MQKDPWQIKHQKCKQRQDGFFPLSLGATHSVPASHTCAAWRRLRAAFPSENVYAVGWSCGFSIFTQGFVY